MIDPFCGEIQMVAFNFAPKDWAECNGAQIQTTQNPALYSLLGSQFGGNAQTYFMLPDLRGRTPIGPDPGSGIIQGTMGGVENAPVSTAMMGAHTHQANISQQDADTDSVGTTDGARAFGRNAQSALYTNAKNLVPLKDETVTSFGSGTAPAHNNIQPTQVIKYVIALKGLYPQRD
jgi:microcystin-dependent protein